MKQELINKVLLPIEEAGFKVFFVGGCVRDKLLGLEPHDFDITTDAKPEQLHHIFSKFSNVSKNSEKFGITMPLVEINGKIEEIEIASFRKDLTKGRHPDVNLDASIEEDASRRDFTINALYEDKNGKIIDPTGLGLNDIKTYTLRFVGNPLERLSEDPLRAYRFVRFLSKGFINPYSVENLNDFKKVLDFSEVSKERKLKEIKKIFSSKYFIPDTGSYLAAMLLGIFEDMGLMKIFTDMSKIEQSFKWHAEGATVRYIDSGTLYKCENVKDFSNVEPVCHGTVLDHTLNVWKEMNKILYHNTAIEITKVNFDEEKRFLLTLAAILHDIGKTKPIGFKTNTFQWGDKTYEEEVPKVSTHDIIGVPLAEKFCKDLCLSNDEIKFITTLVGQHMNAHKFADTKHKFKILEFVHQPLFKEIMLLAQADDRGSIETVVNDVNSPEKNLSLPMVVECMNTVMPNPVLTGNDLISFGEKPNSLFKKKLEVAYRVQIEQNINNKKLLYNIVKNIK